jgi:hypothetical protein
MRLVCSVWNVTKNPFEFEATTSIVECLRRIRDIGCQGEIDVPFLAGIELTPPRVLSAVRDLGGRIHDVHRLTSQLSRSHPRIASAYAKWGGIRHYAFLRFLVMRELFARESVLFFDSDILFNVSPDELAADFHTSNFVLANSTCMGIVSGDWLDALRSLVELFDRDIVGFSSAVGFSGEPNELTDPIKLQGSDQALVRLASTAGLLPITNAPRFYSRNEKYLWSPSWLSLGALGAPLTYERRDQIDLVDGKAMVASHMSNDFVEYLGAYLFIRELGNFEGFGRVPYPGASELTKVHGAYAGGVLLPGQKTVLVRALAQLHEHRRRIEPRLLAFIEDPFSRRNIIERFYRGGDFKEVFNDQIWWEPGVWRR